MLLTELPTEMDKKTIGIYKITNLINQKVYIGQSRNIEKRWRSHRNDPQNYHLRAAFEKYGIANFEFTILREFRETPLTDIFLTVFEQKYIDEYEARNSDKGYNFKEAGPNGGHSEETKKRMSASHEGKSLPNSVKQKMSSTHQERMKNPILRQRISRALTGQIRSAETRQKMSEYHLGRENSPEVRKKISQSLKGRKGPWEGKLRSENTKQKVSIARKGLVYITNGTTNKMVKIDEVSQHEQQGYWRGQTRHK